MAEQVQDAGKLDIKDPIRFFILLLCCLVDFESNMHWSSMHNIDCPYATKSVSNIKQHMAWEADTKQSRVIDDQSTLC